MGKKPIRVEPKNILFPYTYISAVSRYAIKIYNDTKETIHFEWRKRDNEEDDEANLQNFDISDPEQRIMMQNDLGFSSPFFKFGENSGKVYPQSFHQMIVTFLPQEPITYQENAFLYCVETGERFPVLLKGSGLPPEALFSVQCINVGHIALESIFEYEVELRNTGETLVDFELVKKETPGLIFEFQPESGILAVGQAIKMHIKFVANSVGNFNESFTFQVKGSNEKNTTITLYGKVIGPSFSINVKELDYGTVSYGFMYSKTIEIENKSEIPFDYTLRLSLDGSYSRREFSIKPNHGTLEKFEKKQVDIEFIPLSLQDYRLFLYFDISKYAERLIEIPISAKCICPTIQLEKNNIDLGNVFIGFCYQTSLTLIDDTDYPAKYEFVPSTDPTQLQAKTVVPKPNGIIDQRDKAQLQLEITPIQLGPLVLTQFLRIYGSEDPPIMFTISAVCIGPCIKLSQNSIDFGDIGVLEDIYHQINIINDSLIPAVFTASVESETGVFKCDPPEGTIPPNDNIMLSVIANLDDNINFSGKLILVFQNLNPIIVPVKANGMGTTIRSSVSLSVVDMNYIFTEVPVSFNFVLYNHGRKPQDIRWSYQKPKVEGPSNADFTFKIVPDSVIIPPYDKIESQFVFQCNKPASFELSAQCHTTLRKKRAELFTPQISGTFIRPFLQFSQQTIEFHHFHDILAEEQETGAIQSEEPVHPSKNLLTSITHQLKIKNNGNLPLDMFLDCPQPFSISYTKYHLEPQESFDFDITFDPSFKTDFISEIITKKLAVSFEEHPLVNYISLKGFIEFPNVTFSPSTSIEFGNLMINTEQVKDITIDNTSVLPVDLYWELFTDDKLTVSTESIESNPPDKGKNAAKIFDIYPMRAHIEPKHKDVVRFSFFADSNGRSTKFRGTAICHIIGGPEYTISLSGGSAAIEYKIDPLHIDFGDISYKDKMTQTLTLTNYSDVTVSYAIKIPRACKFQTFYISPKEGVIKQNETIYVHMQIVGGVPRVFHESCFVQISHFEEVRVDVKMHCFIPQIQIDLPRHDQDPTMIAYNEIQLRKKAKIRRSVSEVTSDEDELVQNIQPTADELTEIERRVFVSRINDKSFANLTMLRRTLKSGARFDKGSEPMPYDGPISSKFVLNLGNIVFGQKVIRKFKIKSPVPFPISFEIQTMMLEGTGFSIEPVSFENVPPNEELEITVSFNTDLRTNDLIDNVQFEIPIVLNEDMAYLIVLKANLTMPSLNFSTTHCEFGNVIVGQRFIQTIQLQNMNPVPCEFAFGDAQYMNMIQRSMAQTSNSNPIFTASPSSGILPAASFLNVDICFAPLHEKSYSMQFPITIKHNTQASIVTLKGYGIQLKVLFDPPELNLPSLNPFCEPTQAEVKLINPTAYPITVLSSQFDLQLLVDQLKIEQFGENQSKDADAESQVQFSNSTTAKFSICVIVTGAPSSGKTTVSKIISSSMNDAPILNLKEIWKNIVANPEATQADYVEAFQNIISEPEYSNGFVIDGLDGGLPESPELDTFLSHCLKTRNVESELQKNPLLSFPHQFLTAEEQALAYVLASLDGHYVFHIALKAPESVLNARDEIKQAKEKKRKRIEEKQERKMLFNMSEEQYSQLTDEEKQTIDEKRQAIRQDILQAALDDDMIRYAANKARNQRHHTSHRSRSNLSKAKDDAQNSKKPNSRPRSEKGGRGDDQSEETNPRPRRRGILSMNPIQRSIIHFQFTVGSIAQRLREGGESFQVIDPINLQMETPSNSPREEEELQEKTKEEGNNKNIVDEEARANNRNPTPMPGNRQNPKQEPKQPPPPLTFCNMNTMLINVVDSIDKINIEVLKFLPSLNILKEKAFTKMIPQPRLITAVADLKKVSLSSEIPKFFSIVVPDPVLDIAELFPEARPQQKRGAGGRKSRAHHNQKEQNIIPVVPSDIDLSKRTKRWEIEPKSDITIKVEFDAKLVGNYNDILTFSIQNARSEPAKLKVSGLCSYPDIDRTITNIFPKVQRKYDNKISYSYAQDIQEFHFGSVLVVKDKLNKSQIPFYNQTITFKNNSLFPADFTASLIDYIPHHLNSTSNQEISSNSKAIWWIEKSSFSLLPGESSNFIFGTCPISPDLYKTTLLLTIKDNPDPILFNLAIEGCAPTIEMNNKAFSFDRMLLNQTKTLDIELKNTGKLPAAWRLKNLNQLGGNASSSFTFNKSEGVIKPKQTFLLTCTFVSTKPVIVKKNINLEILDIDKNRVFLNTPIAVSVESFDVSFDFQYPKGMDHLSFGHLKVNQTRNIQCIVKNKGKYPSIYKICFTNQKVQKMFNVSPIEGTLQPGNGVQVVTFSFNSSRLVNYSNAKGISLRIADSVTNSVTAELPIFFSATTLYSSFQIEPQNCIDFGSTPVNVLITKQFKIFNTGTFPFDYEVLPKSDGIVVPNPAIIQGGKKKGKKSPVKTPPQIKGRPRKGNEKSIVLGSFTFVPCVGTIPPNGSATIEIDFNCALPGSSRSTALIKISDADPRKVANGVAFSVIGASYVPGLDITNLNNIFAGTQICLRFDLSRLKNATAFLEDEQILHFRPLILQRKAMVPITLINYQPIPITVDLNLVTNTNPKSKGPKVILPFDLSEKSVNIEPSESYQVNILFSPLTAEKFQTVFEANVRNGTDSETQCLRFGVEGLGALPTISLVSSIDGKSMRSNSYSFNLGKTLIGYSKEKTVAIQNDGLIDARISIIAKASPDFILKDVETAAEFILEQEKTLNLPILFHPEKVRKSQFEINISVLDNPKANLNLIFIGEGYSEDITFEGLSDEEGSLIFKDNIVGRQLISSFIMHNVSQDDILFTWGNSECFSFNPKCGHLRRGKTKPIQVTFFSDKPIKQNGLKLHCQWSKIALKDPRAPDWDDSMKSIKFTTKGNVRQQQYQAQLIQHNAIQHNQNPKIERPTTGRKKAQHGTSLGRGNPNARTSSISHNNTQLAQNMSEIPPLSPHPDDNEIIKVTEMKPEPEYTIIPGKYKDLTLKIVAISDYIKYSLDTTDIEFSPTMMYQSRTVECKITNTSTIRFEYQWIVTQFRALRTDYASQHKIPFQVFPTSGYIGAGQSTTFKVKFSPEEVDDFSAVLLCDIPFLTQMDPPKISVNGFSRRPLCHFNVETSDYISGNRRHPDYVQELPEDIKVIEIFSPAIGTRSTKRFEIINPTSSSYEVYWSIIYDTSGGSIYCDNPSAFISSGKRYLASFTYLPTSVKTFETLFEFQIPEHNIHIPILVVGRIMPANQNASNSSQTLIK